MSLPILLFNLLAITIYKNTMQELTNKKLEELFKESCGYQGELLGKENLNNDLYKMNETDSSFALRVMSDLVLMDLKKKLLNKPQTGLTPNDSNIIYYLGTYIRSYYLISELIMKGYDLEAITLMRRSLEILSRISELEQSEKQELSEKMPKMSSTIKDAVRLYGDLTKIAHNQPSFTANFVFLQKGDGRIGASLYPIHDDKLYLVYLDFHRINATFFTFIIRLYFRIFEDYSEELLDSDTFKRLDLFYQKLTSEMEERGWKFPTE